MKQDKVYQLDVRAANGLGEYSRQLTHGEQERNLVRSLAFELVEEQHRKAHSADAVRRLRHLRDSRPPSTADRELLPKLLK